MQRLLVRFGAVAFVTLVLAACSDSAGVLGEPRAEQVSALSADGTFTISGANFFEYEDGRGMRVEVCGVTVPAEIVDAALTGILLPPAGVIRVRTGSELSVQLPAGLTGGSGDLRIIRPDGQVTVVEGAIICPAAPDPEPEPEPEPDPDPDPTAHAVLAANPTEGIAPLAVSFDASGSYGEGDHTVLWDFGDGTTSTENTVQHTFVDDGEFTVTLTITGEDGQSDTATQVITVNPTPAVPVLTADVTEGPAPLTVSFSADGSSGSGDYEVSWDFGDGAVSSVSTAQHTFTEPGEYTVTLTITGENGQTDSATQSISVFAPLTPTARIDMDVIHRASSIHDTGLYAGAENSSDPYGLPLSYLWTWIDFTGRHTSLFARLGSTWNIGSPLQLRLTVTNSGDLSHTAWLTFLSDEPETLWDENLPAHQPDISHAEWGYDGNRAHITVEYMQPPSLLMPGYGLCQPAGIASDAYLGYIAIDIDRDASSGWNYGQHAGMEYVLILNQRRSDGRYPLYRADAGIFDPCEIDSPDIVRWVDVEQDGNRVTFSFDELEGRGNKFNLGVHTNLHPNGESDTLTITRTLRDLE